jgi:hypothetical protein
VLTVADARGNEDSDEMWVTVHDTETPVAVAGPDRTVDMGTTFTLDGGNSTDNVGVAQYHWYYKLDGEQVHLRGVRVDVLIEDPGLYEVRLSVMDAAGLMDVDAFILTVRDNVPPTVPFMEDVSLVRGDRLHLNGSGASDNVAIVNWTWTIKNGGEPLVMHERDVDHTFQTTGTYRVTLTVRDADGNEGSKTFTVTVRGPWLPIATALLVLAVVAVVAAFLLARRRGRKAS